VENRAADGPATWRWHLSRRCEVPLGAHGTRRAGVTLKRIYFLIAIAVLQIAVGAVMVLGAASPVRAAQDVLIPSGAYHHLELGILGTGRLSGSLSELQGRSVDFFVFDDPGYLSFRDGANAVPPLFAQRGTSIAFDLVLAGPALFHVVAVDFPARQELHVRLDWVVVGLKTTDTILAVVVLVGGLALMGASLMMSVWTRGSGPRPPDRHPRPKDGKADRSDDKTRVY